MPDIEYEYFSVTDTHTSTTVIRLPKGVPADVESIGLEVINGHKYDADGAEFADSTKVHEDWVLSNTSVRCEDFEKAKADYHWSLKK